jgi:hypothetical protein
MTSVPHVLELQVADKVDRGVVTPPVPIGVKDSPWAAYARAAAHGVKDSPRGLTHLKDISPKKLARNISNENFIKFQWAWVL